MEQLKLRNQPRKFSSEGRARSYSYRTIKPTRIFLGDDNKYWVVGMADGERLLKAGYEEI